MPRRIPRRPYGRSHRSWPARIAGWLIKSIFGFVLLSILWVLLYRFVPPPITFTMIGDMLGGRSVSRDWMSIDRMDRDMVRAAVAAEDSKFCTHWGFDQDAIAEAMRRNARGGSVIRGGSTISQQTAKNAFLWQGGGYVRKGLEAWFTLLIENLWGKRRIMEVYLNVAETGIGTYGVNAGAYRYFGHYADAMSRTEAARIAAILPLPKKRGAIAPQGFTRRYGNSISAGSAWSPMKAWTAASTLMPPRRATRPSRRRLPGPKRSSRRGRPSPCPARNMSSRSRRLRRTSPPLQGCSRRRRSTPPHRRRPTSLHRLRTRRRKPNSSSRRRPGSQRK